MGGEGGKLIISMARWRRQKWRIGVNKNNGGGKTLALAGATKPRRQQQQPRAAGATRAA